MMAEQKEIREIVIEEKVMKEAKITNENIKNPELLMRLFEQRCNMVTKLAASQPVIYFKEAGSLITFGHLRMNKTGLGTFYIETIADYDMSNLSPLIMTIPRKNHNVNKFTVSNVEALDQACDWICTLISDDKIYLGK